MKRRFFLLVALATLPSAFALPAGDFHFAPVPVGAAPYERRQAQAAASRDLFLVVWDDARVVPNQPRLWAARISRDGKLLDPTGIQIAAFAGNSVIGSHVRAVTSDGTDFLVAYADDNGHVLFVTVTADGKVNHLPDASLGASVLSMNWIGDSYALLLKTPAPFPSAPAILLSAKLDRNHVVTVPSNRSLGGDVRWVSSALMFPDTIVIAWVEGQEHSVRVGSLPADSIRQGAAPLISSSGLSTTNLPVSISVATDGHNALAAWQEQTSEGSVYLARRFDLNGATLSASVTLGNGPEDVSPPTVVWNGLEYAVTFKGAGAQPQLKRLAADATPLDPSPVTIGNTSTDLTIAALTDNVSLVVWNEQNGSGFQLFGNLITPGSSTLRLQSPLLISVSEADRLDATVVWRGDHYLAGWREAGASARMVVGRFSVDGQPLDGPGVTLGGLAPDAAPALASNGRTAVAAWLDASGVASSFIDASGKVSRRSFNFPGGPPAANWNGQQYVVAWRSSAGQLLALRMSGDGVLADDHPVSIAPVSGQPFIGWTGNSYVVVYPESQPCAPFCDPATTLWAQLVSPSLNAIGSRFQLSQPLAGTPVVMDGPAGALAIWSRTVPGPGGLLTSLRGVRVVNGAIIDPLNGFELGPGPSPPTGYGSAAGWTVVSGPYTWNVNLNGAVSPRRLSYPFVAAGAQSSVVVGGPAPLVVYRRGPVDGEQMMQLVARYFLNQTRQRSARH